METVVDSLIAALSRFPDLLAAGEPEQRKQIVGVFLQSVLLEKGSRQAVLRWYRVPRLDEVSGKVVELRGAGLDPYLAVGVVEDTLLALPRPRSR